MDPLAPQHRPPPRMGASLLGWTVLVMGLHAGVLWGVGESLRPVAKGSEPDRPLMEVVGRIELADPLVAGLASPIAAQARPDPKPASPRTPRWVPVPPRPDAARPQAPDAPPLPDPPASPLNATSGAAPEPDPGPEAAPDPAPDAGPSARAEAPASGTIETVETTPADDRWTAGSTEPVGPDTPAVAPPASLASGLAPAPPSPAAASAPPDAPPFEWPPSTRLRYLLTGHYQGEIQGQAQVEWLREGDRYAVHLDVVVGLRIAPLMSRRMSSRGQLTPRGLAPEHYVEATRIAFREPRQGAIRLGPAFVGLADGRSVPAPVGVQDTASQFIQLAYRLSTEAGLARPGGVVELALALPRRVDTWVYDVVGEEVLATPFGPVDTVHLRPRPPARAAEVLTAEIWFAPRLRHLPVRIRIQQGVDTFIDLLIDRLPDVLAPALPSSVPARADDEEAISRGGYR